MKPIIVENPSAPNAIGDTIASFPALHAKAWDSPISVYLSASSCRELLYHPKITQLTEKPESGHHLNIQTLFSQYANSGLSMPQAYMMELDLTSLAKSHYIPEIILDTQNIKSDKKYDFLLSPYSHSDFGTNTKVWPEYSWVLLAQELARNNLKVGLLGTSNDKDYPALEPLCEPILDLSLVDVCRLVEAASCVISVDNGINWITQGMRTNHILLLPGTQHPNWSANRNFNGVNLPLSATTQIVFAAIQRLMQGIY